MKKNPSNFDSIGRDDVFVLYYVSLNKLKASSGSTLTKVTTIILMAFRSMLLSQTISEMSSAKLNLILRQYSKNKKV